MTAEKGGVQGTGVCKPKKSGLLTLPPSLLKTWRSLLMIWMTVREHEASWHSLLEGICTLLA